MNPDIPKPAPEDLEARITALLLGELTPAEEAQVRQATEGNAELARLRDRLKRAIELVRETTTRPAEQTASQPPQPRLSEERRQRLLQYFKVLAPKELARPRRKGMPWFVPMSIAAVLVALLSVGALLNSDYTLSMSKAPAGQGDRVATQSDKLVTHTAQKSYTAYDPYFIQTEQEKRVAVERGKERGLEVRGELNQPEQSKQPEAAVRAAETLRKDTAPIYLPNQVEAGKPVEGTRPVQSFRDVDRVAEGQTLARYGGRPTGKPEAPGQVAGGRLGVQSGSPPAVRQRLVSGLPPSQSAAVRGPAPTAVAVAESAPLPPELHASSLKEIPTDLPMATAAASAVVTNSQQDRGGIGLGQEVEPSVGFGARTDQGVTENVHHFMNNGNVTFTPAPARSGGILKEQAKNVAGNILGVPLTAQLPPPHSERSAGGDTVKAPATSAAAGSEKVPVLGDVPLIGRAFRSEANAVVADRDALGAQTNKTAVPVPVFATPVTVNGKAAEMTSTEAKHFEAGGSVINGTEVRVAAELGAREGLAEQNVKLAGAQEELARLQSELSPEQTDVIPSKPAAPALVPQPEVRTSDNTVSTFSLNVTDVSFKLAGASLEKGAMPDPATVRSEEFINAFDYHDPEAAPGVPIAFAWDRAQYPFAHNRDMVRFALRAAARGREASRPLNLVLLLDNSGSMERADRVRIMHEALVVLTRQLQPQDRISVVAFARTARLWVDALPGGQAGELVERVGNLTPEGGTNLEDALNLAYATAARLFLSPGVNRVVLLTDGAANLGDFDPESLKRKVESWRKQGIALDCFGIGWEGYNDDLLEVLSRNGDGRYGFVNTPEDAATEFAGQLAGALQVAAADVKVQVEFNPRRVPVWRQIGYAKHQLTKEQFRDNTVDAAELAAAESGNALYVVQVDPQGEGDLGVVRARYREPATGLYREHEWPVPYAGTALPMVQAAPALRLAAVASAFSEWLVSSPFAGEVTPDRLLSCFGGVPEAFGFDPRPKKLEWMIRQAKSISGR